MNKVFYFIYNPSQNGIIFPFEALDDYYPSGVSFYIEFNQFIDEKSFEFKINENDVTKIVVLEKISKTRLQVFMNNKIFKFRISSYHRISYTGSVKSFENKSFIRIFPVNLNDFETLYKESKTLFLGDCGYSFDE